MTTAHRPTWAPAKGGEEQGGMRIYAPLQQKSAKDQAAHTQLKFRQDGQNSKAELRARDLKAALEEKERKALKEAGRASTFEEERAEDLRLLETAAAPGGEAAQPRLIPRAQDADEAGSDDSSGSDSDDEEDEEAELLAELERIKKERAEEAAKRAAAEAAEAEAAAAVELARGNPLLQERLGASGSGEGGGFAIKRRWDDDVVFKNQARGEPKGGKRFVNDTIRNDFHKRFLSRYIK